jgi:hypothetical protein
MSACAKKFIDRVEGDQEFPLKIMTGGEMWVYWHDRETK